MGRKGVSKRKTGKTKSKPLGGGAASNSVSSIPKVSDTLPVRAADTTSTIWKKNSKKS